jgi:3'-phosphoadenosine 5'-phosphosulfate sulfotransferase (PAPS reductase)/FAD synthetase
VGVNGIGFDLTTIKENIRKYSTFSIMNPYCTERLKTTPLNKFCNDKFGKGNYVNWLGMRIDEPKRLKNMEVTPDMFGKKLHVNPNVRYLAQISDFIKEDILDWWGIQIRKVYKKAKVKNKRFNKKLFQKVFKIVKFDLEIGEHLGNCVFCVKKSAKKIALAQRDDPELAKLWEECFTDKETRVLPANKYPKGVIYRNGQSLGSIIKMFGDFSDNEIKNSIHKTKSLDSGSCGESCEAQFDLFNEDAA